MISLWRILLEDELGWSLDVIVSAHSEAEAVKVALTTDEPTTAGRWMLSLAKDAVCPIELEPPRIHATTSMDI